MLSCPWTRIKGTRKNRFVAAYVVVVTLFSTDMSRIHKIPVDIDNCR